jgi:hypothetical protein
MAKSKSRKKLLSKIRQGKIDPRTQRGSWNGVNPVSRVKPNKRKEVEKWDG